ncbi:MAG: tetratricopeptide repeat protein, partial [Casimicrobiaceae bacterium]
MTAAAMAEWVARGRAHQSEGRAADALPCFRRAVREDPTSPVPLFHLGEVLWQLGIPADAAGAWHRSAQLAPGFVPPRQALSEAALLHGDFTTALAMARGVAAVAPQDLRNEAMAAAAAAALGDVAALGHSADLIGREPALVQIPSLTHAYAKVLTAADPAARATLHRALVAHVDVAPAELLAVLVEQGAPLPAGLAARTWTWADGDALRRIAVAVHHVDSSVAQVLAGTYAALTAAQPAPAVPLLFPRRTAGSRLRVAWIAPTPATARWSAWKAMLAAARMPEGCEHVVLTVGEQEGALSALTATPLAGASVLAMSTPADIDTGRALAARDCDLLVDAAGLSLATGALLAMRPARTIVALACGAPEHLPPLVDVHVEDAAALSGLLLQLADATGDSGSATVAELMARWDEAVAHHREGDLATAATAYVEILREQPEWAPAWQLAGDIAHVTGDTGKARAAFDRALAVAPDFVEARISGAELALETGDAARAATLAREGVIRAPRDVGLWRMLGRAELGRHDARQAVEAFARALLLAPASADLHFQHGVALNLAGDTPGAARAWQRALTFDPDMVAADFNLGTLFARTGQIDA